MPKSTALLCRTDPETAAVFVHGWGGGGRSTWEHFVPALRCSPKAQRTDVFFVD